MIQYSWNLFFIETATESFRSLMTNPDGRQKYQEFLTVAREKLRKIEYSLAQLVDKGVIDEDSFAPPLSDARRMLEECCAGGWGGFNRPGAGYFGSVVNLEVTLRSMSHSLGGHMVWHMPDKVSVS